MISFLKKISVLSFIVGEITISGSSPFFRFTVKDVVLMKRIRTTVIKQDIEFTSIIRHYLDG